MTVPPRLSIITPTLNRAKWLPATWASLQRQTEKRFEWIVVDNGSTDDTADVVARFGDPRIIFVHEPKRGVNAARARGETLVRSSFVVFLDSDDELYDRETLRVMMHAIESAPDEAGCVGFTVVDNEGRDNYSYIGEEHSLIAYEDVVCESKARGEFLFIYKKEALDAVPWSGYEGMESLRHWAIAKHYPPSYVRRPGRIYHTETGDNLTGPPGTVARAADMASAMSVFIDQHRDTWLAKCPAQYGRYLFYAAMYHALAGQRGRAMRTVMTSLSANGPKLKGASLAAGLLLPTGLRRRLFEMRSRRTPDLVPTHNRRHHVR